MAVEEPAYQVVVAEGTFEVRDYPPLVAAEVTVGGSRDEASSAGFRLLAGYIFGGNTSRLNIGMTAPVVQTPTAGEAIAMTAPVSQTADPGGWTLRFVMPSGYSLASLPVPNDARVRLTSVPASRYAVVRFSGMAQETAVERKTEELEAFIAAHRLVADGPAALARYNPPWTPWFMRRNEVMKPVKAQPTG